MKPNPRWRGSRLGILIFALAIVLFDGGCGPKMDDAAVDAFVDSAMGYKDTLANARRVAGARYTFLLRAQLRARDKLKVVSEIICEGDFLLDTLGADQGSRAIADASRAAIRSREDTVLEHQVSNAMAMHTFGPSNAECDSMLAKRKPVDTLEAYHQLPDGP